MYSMKLYCSLFVKGAHGCKMQSVYLNRLNGYFQYVVRKISTMNRINVNVSSGTVCGIVEKLPDGNDFYAFRGIPYARAPSRFQPPEPFGKFSPPVLDCSKERDVCIAKNPFNQRWQGSEDCLHLNVYTPGRLQKEGELLPVMVFIHGGSYKYGSGNSDCYSPEYLLEQNVIVVTLNYRLGPLGLLRLPSQGVEGNAALKDQLLALRWVSENIGHFQGDPQNVTLFGESAGAVAVHLHLLSPLSTRYFHKAICDSGVALADYGMPNDTVGNTRRLARLINPDAKTDEEILETLRQAPAKLLAELGDRTPTPEEVRRGVLIPFRPSIDADSKEPLLPLHPITAMQTPYHIPAIPLLLGFNNRDGGSFLGHMIKYPKLYEQDLQRELPCSINLDKDSPEAKQLAEEMAQFYFGESGFVHRKVNECADLLTDTKFTVPLRKTAELHSRFQHRSPLYFYRFEFDGMLNLYKKFLPTPLAGAYHADELSYLFHMRMAPMEVPAHSIDARVRRYMCRMWTNFAKYANPTPEHDESLPFRWAPVPKLKPDSAQVFHLPYLRINAEPQMDVDPYKERVDFWERMYKKHNGGFLYPSPIPTTGHEEDAS